MFDEKGSCRHCKKPTRAKATSVCDACFRLEVAIKNNPDAAEKILAQYTRKLKPSSWYEVPYRHPQTVLRPGRGLGNPYQGTRPKENN
jgi:hypothetical protein